MTFESFKKAAFDYAKELNCESAELYFVKQSNTQIEVLEGEIDSYSVSTTGGANLRVVVNGKNGYAYTETLTSAKSLVERAVDNAKVIESTDERPMQTACTYKAVAEPTCRGNDMSIPELVDFAKELETKTKTADKRCKRVASCMVYKNKAETRLCNSLGLDANCSHNEFVYLIEPVLEQDGVLKNAYSFRRSDNFEDVDGCVKEAIDDAAALFGAKSAPSGKYPILIRNDAMTSLLSAFWPVFSADLCQKKLSLLAGKEGDTIASSAVFVTDDPFLAINPRSFDAEGVPSVTTKLIDGGVLTSLLHDLKTSKKAGCTSTSNGGRSGAEGSVTVMPSNLFIESGAISFDELVAKMENGIIVTSMSGTHAGVSTISGDFSLISSGFLVENGKIVRPVDQITIAGNFLAMLKGVLAVGSDITFGLPSSSLIGSPSVLIDGLMVSGE